MWVVVLLDGSNRDWPVKKVIGLFNSEDEAETYASRYDDVMWLPVSSKQGEL